MLLYIPEVFQSMMPSSKCPHTGLLENFVVSEFCNFHISSLSISSIVYFSTLFHFCNILQVSARCSKTRHKAERNHKQRVKMNGVHNPKNRPLLRTLSHSIIMQKSKRDVPSDKKRNVHNFVETLHNNYYAKQKDKCRIMHAPRLY